MISSTKIDDVKIVTRYNKPMQVKLSTRNTLSLIVGDFGARALRKIFVGYAEYRALETLRFICKLEGFSCIEDDLKYIVQTTIVPAYANGWMSDVITLSQLQKWLERRLILSFADPLFEQIGLHQYLLLHCLTSGLQEQKLSYTTVLTQCPAASFIFHNLFDDIVLEEWRSGASVVRMAIQALEPKDGLSRWLAWVNTPDDETHQIENILE